MSDEVTGYERRRGVRVLYTNHRGQKDWRDIVPLNLYFGQTAWHQESQWLLNCFDLEKQEMRTFAVSEIEVWRPLVDHDWERLAARRKWAK